MRITGYRCLFVWLLMPPVASIEKLRCTADGVRQAATTRSYGASTAMIGYGLSAKGVWRVE
jgi:hypothetical protein